MKWFKVFLRSSQKTTDAGAICNDTYNEAAGATKTIIVQPDIQKKYVANDIVGAGKLIKVTAGGVYSLSMLGKAYVPANKYKSGNVVVDTGSVYVCDIPEDEWATGAFDPERWTKVAPAVIAGIPVRAGEVVTTGRWHNSITVGGFVVEDDSSIGLSRVR